jgi:hypothetical protein
MPQNWLSTDRAAKNHCANSLTAQIASSSRFLMILTAIMQGRDLDRESTGSHSAWNTHSACIKIEDTGANIPAVGQER